jgi:hypothetical protein
MSITDYTELKVRHLYDFTYEKTKYESAEYIKHKKLYSKDYVVFRIPGHGPLKQFLFENISDLQLHKAKISSLQALASTRVKKSLDNKMYAVEGVNEINERLEFINSEGKKGGKRKSMKKINKRRNKKRTIRKRTK